MMDKIIKNSNSMNISRLKESNSSINTKNNFVYAKLWDSSSAIILQT
jgi:hypothetical protein